MEPLRKVELKILVLGHVGVGKTSLIQRFCYNNFSNNYKSTIGLDYGIRDLEWRNEYLFTLQMCDVSGQERFANLTRVFYRGASGCLVVFDLNNPDSLEKAREWKQDLDAKLPGLPCLLVGNKCDLSSLVPMEDIEYVVRNYKFDGSINASAKKDINVKLAIKKLLDHMVEEVPPTPRRPLESPRSAQHQYDDRPSPRFRVKEAPQLAPEKGVIQLKKEEQEAIDELENECCWLL